MGFRTSAHRTFDMDRHGIPFLQRNPFMSSISRSLRKRPTDDILTAAVSYDIKLDEFALWYNQAFMAGLTDTQVHGTLKHEFYHIVFRHLTDRLIKGQLGNIAQDMAIDYLIWTEAETEHNCQPGELPSEHWPLPLFAARPGFFPADFKTGQVPSLKEQDDEKNEIGRAIRDAPPNMSSEWYYSYLLERCPKAVAAEAAGEKLQAMFDDHSIWEELPPELREKIENAARAVVERAVRHADGNSSGWGHISAEMRELIRKSVSATIDWRALLRQFYGTVCRGESRRVRTVRDRKYGLTQPGLIMGHTAKLVVVIDQSASVGDEMLMKFFGELESATRKLSVTVIPFDSACRIEDAWEWKKGARPELNREKCGGTDFDAPTQVINDNFRTRGWEGAIFMTDGQCSQPGPTLIKRAWVLGEGCKIDWATEDLIISMDDSIAFNGSIH